MEPHQGQIFNVFGLYRFRLPEWTHKVFIPGGVFEYLAEYWLIFTTGTTELKRLKSGFLLKEIFDRFKKKTLSLLPDELMYIYSGHDITIGGLLNSLGVFEVSIRVNILLSECSKKLLLIP